MVKRQFPNPVELAKLMKFKAPELNGKKRRLDSALTIYDLKAIAKRRTPKAAFDYTDGSAEGEISLSRARQAFEDIEFHPSILRDASHVDTTTKVLGGTSAMPFGIAPTGFTRLMQTEGEIAGAGAAAAAGIPFTLSTLGTTSIEDVKATNPDGRNWFQLYVMRQREISYGLVERAAAAGYDTLMFTVDTPVAGARLRDKRNGFSIPPQLTAGTIVNALPRPWWWFDFLTTPRWSSPHSPPPAAQSVNSSTRPWTRQLTTTTCRSSATCGPARSSSRVCKTWKTPNASLTSVLMASCSQTTAAANSTGHPSPSTCCRALCVKWATTLR
ncbi:L-lactate dehydrogenase [Leifsonia rubra CMS 76R]|nr:L-lactate dehydrogenase [Leifsonia rubra CMS 76R]